jgi:Na+-transporting NADH:ubiquinone oxidoreductase subunit C
VANKDTIQKTFIVALLLCVVCSIIVSTASVKLKPAQLANKQMDFNKNILQAAGIYDPALSVDEQFEQIDVKVIDLRTGKFTDEVSADTYDQRKASKDPKFSEALTKETDIAGIKRQEYFSEVYLVNGGTGLEKVILPIRGYGLWSVLYGFLALEADFETVVGIGYYEHGETPGLGGEVDNPNWKSIWEGRKVYGENGELALSVVKGQVTESTPGAEHKIDGLSGATLTTNGVDNMIKFWLGESGFASFIENLKAGEA